MHTALWTQTCDSSVQTAWGHPGHAVPCSVCPLCAWASNQWKPVCVWACWWHNDIAASHLVQLKMMSCVAGKALALSQNLAAAWDNNSIAHAAGDPPHFHCCLSGRGKGWWG